MDEKLMISSELVKNNSSILISQPSILYPLISARFVVLIKSLQALAYLFASIWMLSRYLKSGKKNHIISGQQIMTKWLMVLLGFLLILAVSDSILQIETIFTKDSRLFSTLNVFRISSSIGLVGLMISPFFFPSILYGLPLVPSSTVKIPEEDMEKKHTRQVDRKMKLHVLENEYLMRVESILESSMSELKPYLKNDFNLTQLSVMINIPVHHLAYFFREHLHQSFHDYRNKWRIEHSKNLILEGKTKELTLEAIGQLSGFSSRNTFFIAFKQAEGISPSEYTFRILGHS
jgi:AraC-like DNA-binding protein